MVANVLQLAEPARTSFHDRSSAGGAQAWLARVAGVESFEETGLPGIIREFSEFQAFSEALEDRPGAAQSASNQLSRISQQLTILERTVELLPWAEAGAEEGPFDLLTPLGVAKLRERVELAQRFVGGRPPQPAFDLLSGLEEWAHSHGLELTGILVVMVEIATKLRPPVPTSQELDKLGRPWRKEIEAWLASPEREQMLKAFAEDDLAEALSAKPGATPAALGRKTRPPI